MIRYAAVLGLAAGLVAIGDASGQALLATAPVVADPADSGRAPGAIDLRPNPPAPAAPTANTPIAKERPLSGNPLWAVPLKLLSATRDRPIFSPSRRPPPPPVLPAAYAAPAPAAPKPTESGPPQLSLVGTVVGDSESIGIFLDQATKAVVRLRTGQDHSGWILRSVRGREATFDKDQRTATFMLPPPGTDATAPPGVGGMDRAGQGTSTDGDGQLIAPPPPKPSQPAAPASPTAVQ